MQPFVPTTYFTSEDALNHVARSMADNGARLENLRRGATQIQSEIKNAFLAAPTGWNGLFAYIDQQAAALPNDTTWSALKARKDKLVSDFRALEARTDNIVTAIAGL